MDGRIYISIYRVASLLKTEKYILKPARDQDFAYLIINVRRSLVGSPQIESRLQTKFLGWVSLIRE